MIFQTNLTSDFSCIGNPAAYPATDFPIQKYQRFQFFMIHPYFSC